MRRHLPAVAGLLLLLGQNAAQAQSPFPTPPSPGQAQAVSAALPVPHRSLVVEAGSGQVIGLHMPAASVFAADPKVAEVRPASPTSLFIFGVAPGRTTVAALDSAGHPIAQYDVTVRASGYGGGEATSVISHLLPGRNIQAVTTENGMVLKGEVATPAEAEEAMRVARAYVSGKQTVENHLTVLSAVQVLLRVRIAEMDRSITRSFGINWQALGNIGRFSMNFMTNSTLPTIGSAAAIGAGYASKGADVNGLIDALAQDNLIRLLAEPNLTSMSGESASFLAGGEFPIPVPQGLNTMGITFQQYGVQLAFVPTVLSNGRISLHVRPEVSELSNQGSVQLPNGNSSVYVPALTVRRAETTVELGSGQSFAIAGLLQDTSTQSHGGLLGLGELPIIGSLFSSDSFQRDQTELVIVITPYIVNPTSNPAALQLPGQDWQAPNDLERILEARQRAHHIPVTHVRIPGNAGFIVQ